MPKNKKRPSALEMKISILLKISIFLAKLKKPIIPMLVSLKENRKMKKFKLLRNYSHYIKEYEFSPSNTPLIQFHRRPRKFEGFFLRRFYFSKCFGGLRGREEEEGWCLDMGLEPLPCADANSESGRELMVLDLCGYSSGELDSVDERAERFIQKFYDEMRRQRHETQFLLEM